MPKAVGKKRNGTAQSSPYANTKAKGVNNIFKMNTELGQHVLKNPGVAQAIVDKADLKQSDVSLSVLLDTLYLSLAVHQSPTSHLSSRDIKRPAREIRKVSGGG